MRRLPLLLAALTLTVGLLLAAAGDASTRAPTRHDAYPLKLTSAGPRVCAAQWLLMGRRPSVYRSKRFQTLERGRPSCYYGTRTAAAVVRMKRELGYPAAHLQPLFGRTLYRYLTGKQARPVGYIARAARRRADEVRERNAARLTYAARIIALAQRELGLGVREIPDGSNYDCYGRGAPCRIRAYQAITGAFRAPWCVSFVQYLYWESGLGTFANRSAGVFYTVAYARARGWLRTAPKPGMIVNFMDRLGHQGLVERVVRGGIWSIEGNASNRVLRRYHPLSNYRPKIYIEVPGLQRAVPSGARR